MNAADLNTSFVRTFQQRTGCAVDGVAGSETHAALDRIAPPSGQRVAESMAESGLIVTRSLRLPEDQYLPEHANKDLIVLHHTSGGSAKSTFDWWRTTSERIGVAYIVERDGTVYEVFDPRGWAYHLGIKATAGRVDRRSVGIEIASEGGLTEADGKLYAFGSVSSRTEYRGEVYKATRGWRGYQYFAAYTRPALESVFALVEDLIKRFGIPREIPGGDPAPLDYAGVASHFHFRTDKSDCHPGFPWDELREHCELSTAPAA